MDNNPGMSLTVALMGKSGKRVHVEVGKECDVLNAPRPQLAHAGCQ